MDLIDAQLGIHATALQLRARRLELLASNIANAATPGYKARDLDFRTALASAEAGRPATPVQFRVPVQNALDGNTVELATEQLQFAENSVQYRTTLAFLNGRIGTLMAAIKGGE